MKKTLFSLVAIIAFISLVNTTVTEDEKLAIVERINMYRCLHDVPALTWSEPLYQHTVATFDDETMMTHDFFNSYEIPVKDGGSSGENLANGDTGYFTLETGIDLWYNEVNNCLEFPGC